MEKKKYYYKNNVRKGTLCVSSPIQFCGIPKDKLGDYEEITQEEYEKLKKSQ